MRPIVTGFANSPDHGEGHSRDLRVRWALEEVGQPYDVRLVPMGQLKEPEHRARHPFGKIPTYEEGGLTLFESGAIVLHIANRYPGLLPADTVAREQAIAWMFAALSTVEPPIVEREAAMLLEADKAWFADRQSMLDDRVRERLGELSAFFGRSDWLVGEFSAADLMMITVLRRLEASNFAEAVMLLEEYPALSDYVSRGKDRPAYKRASAAERKDFEKTSQPATEDA